jgi:hypothetical protein
MTESYSKARNVSCGPRISDNFLYNPETQRVWMVNFQYVNVLPESFFGLYLHGSGGPFL